VVVSKEIRQVGSILAENKSGKLHYRDLSRIDFESLINSTALFARKVVDPQLVSLLLKENTHKHSEHILSKK